MPTFNGLPTCTCGEKWLPVYQARLASFGIGVRFTQLIGNYGPSGGTHGGGLCFDLVIVDPGEYSLDEAYDIAVREARNMGADATWERGFNWDNRGGIRHVHGLGTGCPHLAGAAKAQQVAVEFDRNGLANKAPDPGPRPLSGRTWRQGIEWAAKNIDQEDDMPTPQEIGQAVWHFGLQAVEKGKEWGRPAENAGTRLNAAVTRAGRALIVSRENRADIAGLQAAVREIAKKQGIDQAAIQKVYTDGAKAALKNLEVTLTVDGSKK